MLQLLLTLLLAAIVFKLMLVSLRNWRVWKTSKMSSENEYLKFNAFFDQIRKDMTSCEHFKFKDVMDRIDRVLMYRTPGGKQLRAKLLMKCFSNFASKDIINEEKMKRIYAVGWCGEIAQAACLLADDIMDKSTTRRGKLCWHLKKNNSIHAINDFTVLRFLATRIADNYCKDEKYSVEVSDLRCNIMMKTMFGQILDCLTTEEGKRPDFELLNDNRYAAIVKYKTSYYSFVLPVRTALYLAEIEEEIIHSELENILLRIGHLFQAQDDYLDVYGDPNVTGKVGTDIADGKCSWLAVQAYKAMNENQRLIFESNYALKHRVPLIEMLFDELKMKTVFNNFKEKEYKEINNMLIEFEKKHNVNVDSIRYILQIIYKRIK